MAAQNPFSASQAAQHVDLASLASSQVAGGTGAAASPFTEEAITALLHARARADMPYTRVSPSGTDYVVVNPLRALACLNDEAAKGYQQDFDRTDGGVAAGGEGRQPSVYELAGRLWLMMSRRKESQAVLYHGLTGSGKSSTMGHLTSQLIRLSTTTKAQRRLGDQVSHLLTMLESFGNSKTGLNPSASQHARYFEMHFTPDGSLVGANVLAFGLNKSRLGRLLPEERTFHVFYQLLAGASPDERESLRLDDPDTYALLSSSNCYRLPAGPFSDDATQLGELRAAFAALGFKAKHVRSIFGLLTAILVLSNLTFTDDRATGSLGMTSFEESTRVVEQHLLQEVSVHLGVQPESLEAVLINRTKWVRRELASIFLDAEGAASQRDSLMRDLYAILFVFVVEMANKRLAPTTAEGSDTLQIVQFDMPGYQSRTQTAELDPRRSTLLNQQTLISASGQNGFYEFSVNFSNELVHSYLLRRTFEDDLLWNRDVVADGIKLPSIQTMDNGACVELLRGGLLGSKRLAEKPLGLIGALADVGLDLKGESRNDVRSQAVIRAFNRAFGSHSSFASRPAQGFGPANRQERMFGINHYAGQVSYDATDFLESNEDVFDKQLVGLLRSSQDPFISKLVSGPALATEGHPQDDNIVVEAQVSLAPLRTPTPIVDRIEGSQPQGSIEWPINTSIPQFVTAQLNATLSTLFDTLDRTRVWGVYCLRPNDSGNPGSFDRRRLRQQVRTLLLPDLVQRREIDYVADYPLNQFCIRHSLPAHDMHASVEEFAQNHGWAAGTDYAIGNERIWLSYGAFREQEDLIRSTEVTRRTSAEDTLTDHEEQLKAERYSRGNPLDGDNYSRDYSGDNLYRSGSQGSLGGMAAMAAGGAAGYGAARGGYGGGGGRGGGYDGGDYVDSPPDPGDSQVWLTKNQPYAPLPGGDQPNGGGADNSFKTTEKHHHATEVVATSAARRWWIRIVWFCTWWIPSFLLRWPGGMHRPDIRMAWREKVTICMMIAFMCGIVIFYIIIFGRLLCPDMDKAWNQTELSQHQGDNDFFAAINGYVYDFTTFIKSDHSDIQGRPAGKDLMMSFAGKDLWGYFPPPLYMACSALLQGTDSPQALQLMYANFTPQDPSAVHTSGPNTWPGVNTVLNNDDWYWVNLSPRLKKMYKGSLVWDKKTISQAVDDDTSKIWGYYNNRLYDLSDYIYTVGQHSTQSGEGVPKYDFIDKAVVQAFKDNSGGDITKGLKDVFSTWEQQKIDDTMTCLNTAFYRGQTDFRKTARCEVQNYLLLSFSIILMTTIGAKFIAALQLGGKRNPELLDKFVVCQVPCYTEGEESLKKTIDSLAILQYDDKRKLIFIICDGNIVGSGNNRPTPRIVLDILGVDPKLDPEPLLFKSIGEGSKQLNYGKVYSGLYEIEGHVVPYVVVVKVGKPSETSRPGNRGKRDSQVLLMQYLNRVHFDAPMCPLELEIYHQMRNVIGIDPTFYEYIFQVDADTTVTPESLNRLISCASDDSQIIGICGETKLANERESITTMIQVYEYYISHHLTKAFESLFGSVTCLPGCFSVYRIRTADKGRPVIISGVVIDQYAEPNVDTLHKKNLFSLGEDRYLTTLMMKHFPTFKMKFTPDAIAHTVAPSRWNVLLSQRRRWINSTIHNLVELLFLPEMCGFCLFSMRFIVFIDLLGTIILPATCAYLIYLIVVVSTHAAPIPYISIGMIAAVYGLQAIIFILKREFMLIGWMVVYMAAYPVYSVFLPCYSFWSMDDFSWGNTRRVVGEGKDKMVVYDDEERFDDSMIPYRTFKEYEANAWETASLPDEDRDDRGSEIGRNSRRTRSRYAASIHSSAGPHSRGHSDFSSRNASPTPYHNQPPRMPSMANMSDWGRTGSMYQQPFAPPMPFGGNPFESPAMSVESFRPPTMYPQFAPSPLAAGPPMAPFAAPGGMGAARGSTYSLATTANPYPTAPMNPTSNPSPTDDEVLAVLRTYLGQQDLMNVTKRSARDAMYGLFPNANLQARAAWLNENIDKILSE